MGTFKKFTAGAACETLQVYSYNYNTSGKINTCTYYDVSGNSFTGIYIYGNYYGFVAANFSPYADLIPSATADELSNYSFTDYSITEVGTTAYSSVSTIESTGGSRSYVVSVTNSGADSITVKCVKFKKPIKTNGTNSSTGGVGHPYCLMCAYYLDQAEWMTVPAGETRSLSITMSVGA